MWPFVEPAEPAEPAVTELEKFAKALEKAVLAVYSTDHSSAAHVMRTSLTKTGKTSYVLGLIMPLPGNQPSQTDYHPLTMTLYGSETEYSSSGFKASPLSVSIDSAVLESAVIDSPTWKLVGTFANVDFCAEFIFRAAVKYFKIEAQMAASIK